MEKGYIYFASVKTSLILSLLSHSGLIKVIEMLQNSINPQDVLRGHKAAAEFLNGIFTAKSLAKFACTHRHGIPVHRIGGAVVYRKSELEIWLASYLCGGV